MIRAISVLVFCSVLIGPTVRPVKKESLQANSASLPGIAVTGGGGFLYTSAVTGARNAASLAGSDIRAQTRGVLDRLASVLKDAGSGLDRVVMVNVYLRNTSDFAAMNEVYQTYWPKDPPARTTVASDLGATNLLVEMSAVAVLNVMPRQVVQPPDWIKSPNPYSYGILSGDTMYLAGLLARNGKDNLFMKGDIKAQTKAIMENATEILKTGGMAMSDVVATRIYITDTAFFQDLNAIYHLYFPKDPPAGSTVKSALMSPDAVVEISFIAVKADDRQTINVKNPDGSPAQPNPNFSTAIRVGNRLFVSGILNNDVTNRGNVLAQTSATLQRIKSIIMVARFGWHDVVESLVYVTDAKNMRTAYSEYKIFLDNPIAVQTGLLDPDALVEIICIADKNRTR